MRDLLNDKERDAKLNARPTLNHLTIDQIKAKVVDAQYINEGVLTLAILTLENGYIVTGQSACADPMNFDLDLGKRLAFDDAVKKIWPLEGYLLRQKLYEEELEVEKQEMFTEAVEERRRDVEDD